MPRIKKFGNTLSPKLSEYAALVYDVNPSSFYFNITSFKDTFVSGKNLFYIEGTNYLKEDTPVKIDIRDSNDNPVYYEPGTGTPEYYNGIAKPISVHIYDDTPIGEATITVIGELSTYVDDTGITRPVPDDWVGVYNVLWQRKFRINRLLPNEDPVIFYTEPTIEIEEIESTIPFSEITSVDVSGIANGFSIDPPRGFVYDNYANTPKFLIKNTTHVGEFNDSMINSTIIFNDINYISIISDVINSNTLVLKSPYLVNGIVSDFENQSYVIKHKQLNSNFSHRTGSFAKITLKNLKTFSGDVKRVKILRKSLSDISDYQIIQDIPIESTELLVDYTDSSTGLFYGKFTPEYYEYWDTGSIHPLVSPVAESSYLYSALKFVNTSGTILTTKDSIDIDHGSEYTVSFNVRYSGSISQDANINVYLSGSLDNGVPYKQHITTVYSNHETLQKTVVSKNIIAAKLNDAKLYLDVSSSGWYVSDVSIRTASEFGFSPDTTTIIQPIERTVSTESFDFVFQFYDINNNFIPVYANETITFDKGNVVDDGVVGVGIIFRGSWSLGVSYVFDYNAKRRDAVYYDGSYYAVLQTNVDQQPPLGASNAYWEYLGEQDFFVAAKVSIFEESTVQNTLRVGTDTDSSIVIDGSTSNPYISIAQGSSTGFMNDGIYLGYDNDGNASFSIKKDSSYLQYNDSGSQLEIAGVVNATSGRIGGFTLTNDRLFGSSGVSIMVAHPTPDIATSPVVSSVSSEYWGLYLNRYNYMGSISQGDPDQDPTYRIFAVGDEETYLRFNGEHVLIKSPNFNLNESIGSIANFNISGYLTLDGPNAILDSAGGFIDATGMYFQNGRVGNFDIRDNGLFYMSGSSKLVGLYGKVYIDALDDNMPQEFTGYYTNRYNYMGVFTNNIESYVVNKFAVGNYSNYIRFDGTDIQINTPSIRFDANSMSMGNLTLTGTMLLSEDTSALEWQGGTLSKTGINLDIDTAVTEGSSITFNSIPTLYATGIPFSGIFDTALSSTGRLTLESTDISGVWSNPSIVLRNDSLIDITGKILINPRTPPSSVSYSSFLDKYTGGDFVVNSNSIFESRVAFNAEASVRQSLTWNNSNSGNGNVGALTTYLTGNIVGGDFETSPTLRLPNIIDTSMFGVGNTVPLEISVAGINSWYVCRDTSTIKVKDVLGVWDSIDALYAIRSVPVKEFYYKSDVEQKNKHVGFIAEDFDKIGLSEAVIYNNISDVSDVVGVNRKAIDAILWKAVQDLLVKVDLLESEIQLLKQKNI